MTILTQELLEPGHYEANIVADSVSEAGYRLTSFVVNMPRIILAEFNTPRVFSRNSASTRAIPVATQLRRILDDPFIPEQFGIQRPGMQATSFAEGAEHAIAVKNWLLGRDLAVLGAVAALGGLDSIDPVTEKPMLTEELRENVSELDKELGYSAMLGKRLDSRDMGIIEAVGRFTSTKEADEIFSLDVLQEPLHKQLAGRPLEPWMWQTVFVSGTEWANFFALRNNPAAQPEIMKPARSMQEAHEVSKPKIVKSGEWHTPLVGFEGDEELNLQEKKKASTGRGARVSYLTHARKRDISADFGLHDGLLQEGHMSPFEHPARPQTKEELDKFEGLEGLVTPIHGNFRGWHQYRKDILNEDNFGARNN